MGNLWYNWEILFTGENIMDYMKRLENCVKQIRKITDFEPEVALVLGSGLGDYAKNIDVVAEVSYTLIKGFPVSTVAGHDGKFVFGTVGDKKIVAMKGRVHYYEGYKMEDVVLPMRVMKMLGATKVILTNAAGGMDDDMNPGDFMMITDHISCFVPSPLIGPNLEKLGTRFPDMSQVYSLELQKKIEDAAQALQIPLKKGVYIQLTGPQYETPTEIQMMRKFGNACGMSTVVEAIAARHMGLEICGISLITNKAAGLSKVQLNHEEVKAAADKAAADFEKLVSALIKSM